MYNHPASNNTQYTMDVLFLLEVFLLNNRQVYPRMKEDKTNIEDDKSTKKEVITINNKTMPQWNTAL